MSKKVMNLDETPSDSGWILDSDEAKLEMQLATQGDEKYVLGSLTEDEKQELAMLLEQCAGKDPDALIDALKQRSARFVLAKRTWRGPIQVRFGPSTKVYSLFVKSDGKVWRLDLQDDPTEEDEIAGTPESGTKVMDTSGDSHDVFDLKKGQTVDLKPGSAMNPTKETPAKLEVLDQGEADVMTEETTARKYKFKGSGLKGVWFFHPEEPDEPQSFWLMTKSGGPETKGGPGSGHHGHAGRPGKVGGSVTGGFQFPSQLSSAPSEVWFRGVAEENRHNASSIHQIDWFEREEGYFDLPESETEARASIEQLYDRGNYDLYGALTGEVVEVDGTWFAITDGVFASNKLTTASRFGGDYVQVLSGHLRHAAYDGDIISQVAVLAEFPATEIGFANARRFVDELFKSQGAIDLRELRRKFNAAPSALSKDAELIVRGGGPETKEM